MMLKTQFSSKVELSGFGTELFNYKPLLVLSLFLFSLISFSLLCLCPVPECKIVLLLFCLFVGISIMTSVYLKLKVC